MAIIISCFRQEIENEYLLDVSHPEDLDFSCTDTDIATVGFEVNDLDNQELCWRNVRIDKGNIFDFHPGNSAARDPISEKSPKQATLHFSSRYGMRRRVGMTTNLVLREVTSTWVIQSTFTTCPKSQSPKGSLMPLEF
ncbi:hypothetical protein IV203_015841 [Nitzschia inconspicua]|uniref:Uncharacterized protein n=1 Tax=Nitzschia inconspicua TaxID=303405 RepID=A0A9K3LBZ5_9STRA|nr:hypothetical protein IV203_015841 [Nitzschia inconspicua]